VGLDELKLKPMDFDKTFPEIMKSGGFDAIVGNPPYVLSRETMDNPTKEYYSNHYATIWEKPNTFNLFLERGYSLTKERGFLSYIIPNSWLTIEACKLSRKLFISERSLKTIDDLNYGVFNNVGVEPLILVMTKNSASNNVHYRRLFSK